MTQDERSGFVAIMGLVGFVVFIMGFWAGLTMYRHDTFDCTKVCDGKHSIYNNDICYCEVESK
jgi:hypothetical protein